MWRRRKQAHLRDGEARARLLCERDYNNVWPTACLRHMSSIRCAAAARSQRTPGQLAMHVCNACTNAMGWSRARARVDADYIPYYLAKRELLVRLMHLL